MSLFDELLSTFEKGFLLSNFYESLASLKSQNFSIQKEGNNFFIYEKNLHLMYFFINENKKFKLKNTHLKLLAKNKAFDKFKEFLQINNFSNFRNFTQMILKNEKITIPNFNMTSFAELNQVAEIKAFLGEFFSLEYLFYFSEEELKEKILQNEVLIYTEDKLIKGALIFSKHLNSVFLDFIAVSKDLKNKKASFALLCDFINLNKEVLNFKLFVDDTNEKAINFYKRSNFINTNINLAFYRNFNEF
ncbi:GNAT family N-acetyltransferase [Campylobacter sp. LR185c]|uniref:GNAT family N-acetyltransferase n=1 Tax=Campylobacter sp. LR185c TaxID=2014525 RepID=UPI0012380728|nr:GNAT family N-acetyltransferase [Campylobacter sp. LR185c]KAA6227442.1 GNAT family N-acetyltransferase [Campylobacter sp. LR185c]KAA8603215.1 GNAT family N-acetyltransferase [Campylobacter sp. LR185c]